MITVALPIYNNKEIAWLAMEGLCRQQGITFEWELLIAEEQNERAFGHEAVAWYADRLAEIGCVSLKYFPLDYKIPLPQKWRLLAQNRDSSSIAFLLQASDDYPEPNRLANSYSRMHEGYDWAQNRYGYFYNIKTQQLLRYDARAMNTPTGLNMACAPHLLDRLEESWQPSAVDRWFIKSVKPQNIFWDEQDKPGIYTDGYNSISTFRKVYYSKVERPFSKTDKEISDLMPADILEQLNKMK